MKKNRETRSFPFEVRADDPGVPKRLEGRAVVFDTETIVADMFREVIRPGAFTKTLNEFNQVMLWNHNTDKPLARKSAGTLRLNQTESGVDVSADMPDSTWGNDAYTAVKRGDVNGMSFAMDVLQQRWNRSKEGELPLREILEVRMYEVSPVTFPQYETTTVEARAILEQSIGDSTDATPEPDNAHSEADAVVREHFESWRLRVKLLEQRS